MSHFNYNGKLIKDSTPIIGADNRGLRYGDGLFETMKMRNGKIQLEDDHFARLWKGMATLQFDIPKHFNPDTLSEMIMALAEKNQQQQAARIRVNVFRGDGGLYDAKNHQPNYVIQTWALPDTNGAFNSNGLVLGIYDAVQKSCDLLSNLKTNNYLPYVMAALYAKNEKCNDALLINQFGRICDSTIANVFLVKDERVFTPALKEGCVAGVMRNKIIGELKNTAWPVEETSITPQQLLQADEIFLSNSMYNIRWVQRIGDHSFGNDITQKIYAAVVPTIG